MSTSSRASITTGSHGSSGSDGRDLAVSLSRERPSTVQAQGLGHYANGAAGAVKHYFNHHTNNPPNLIARQALNQPWTPTTIHGGYVDGFRASTPPDPSFERIEGSRGAWRDKIAAGMRAASTTTDSFHIQSASKCRCAIECGKHQVGGCKFWEWADHEIPEFLKPHLIDYSVRGLMSENVTLARNAEAYSALNVALTRNAEAYKAFNEELLHKDARNENLLKKKDMQIEDMKRERFVMRCIMFLVVAIFSMFVKLQA
ncbi:hypothetical protein ACUV84_038203 [Puccinellia chinampoensis]